MDQNVLKSFKMAIGHNRQTTRTEIVRVSVAGFIFSYVQKYFRPVYEGLIAPSPLWIRQ